jgi:hypothetical protein
MTRNLFEPTGTKVLQFIYELLAQLVRLTFVKVSMFFLAKWMVQIITKLLMLSESSFLLNFHSSIKYIQITARPINHKFELSYFYQIQIPSFLELDRLF